jgi:hypothetical protein
LPTIDPKLGANTRLINGRKTGAGDGTKAAAREAYRGDRWRVALSTA